MIINNKDIIIKDSLFNPQTNQRKIYFGNSAKKKKLYKVWVYLEGPGLSFVDNVIYKLHSSFNEPERKVVRSISNPNCSMQIWTWGLFTIEAGIYFQTGELLQMRHYTTYDRDLNNDGSSYSEVNSFV